MGFKPPVNPHYFLQNRVVSEREMTPLFMTFPPLIPDREEAITPCITGACNSPFLPNMRIFTVLHTEAGIFPSERESHHPRGFTWV